MKKFIAAMIMVTASFLLAISQAFDPEPVAEFMTKVMQVTADKAGMRLVKK